MTTKYYLFNFPPVADAYSVCPFAIKLESFCRVNGIPYATGKWICCPSCTALIAD